MCGVFGFISSQGEGPDVSRLKRLAVVTQTRGAHAFGLAWLDKDGRFETFKQPGPATTHLNALDHCRDAVVLIGHCRYATHGLPTDNRNNHPHVAGAGFFVHNGVVYNHRELARRHGLFLRSQCDSEVLGLLMARGAGSIVQRSAWAANQAAGDLAMLGVWRAPARLLVSRRGRPLHFGQGREGFYFASLALGLPGRVQAVSDCSTHVLAYENGALRTDGQAMRLDGGDELGPA